MFRKVTASGLICILHADNERPLKLWDKKMRDGKLRRVNEPDMNGAVLDFSGKVPYINYLSCPADLKSQLCVKHPFLVLTVKPRDNSFFALDVQILDDTGTRRRFRFASGQVIFDVQTFYCRIPLVLEEGWNNIVLPLRHLTKEVYGTGYVETLRIQIYPSCKIKKLYFADKDYDEEELPKEFRHRSALPMESPTKRRCEEGVLRPSANPKARECDRPKKPEVAGKHSAREVIPRVIPIGCGLNTARATYSSL